MKQYKRPFVVVDKKNKRRFETVAVSEVDAINHIHYKLWFGLGEWTEMRDFYAVPRAVVEYNKLKEKEHKNAEYEQMDLWGFIK